MTQLTSKELQAQLNALNAELAAMKVSAKTKKSATVKTQLTPEQKLKIVAETFNSSVPQISIKHGVPESNVYRWRKNAVDALSRKAHATA